MTLYRVIRRSTSSLQPAGSFWNTEILYCGYDQTEAVRVYHSQGEKSGIWNYGSPYFEVKLQRKEVRSEVSN